MVSITRKIGIGLALALCLIACNKATSFVTVRNGAFVKDGRPFSYIGTNFWYGPILASDGQGGDFGRLSRELDTLKSLGINNLRVLVGADGANGVFSRVEPTLQVAPGVYNDTILTGLDRFLVELGKRDMQAVLYVNNSWEWSGGYGQYLEWATGEKALLPLEVGYWPFMQQMAKFQTCKEAQELYFNHLRNIVGRTNSLTGKPYKEDPAIFAWQLGNEPRCFSDDPAARDGFIGWMTEAARIVKEIDPNHLLSTGNEGVWGCEMDWELTERVNTIPGIDYMTIHIWPYNWGWAKAESLREDLPAAIEKTEDYIARHAELAQKLGMPLVAEEFGFPRDGFSPAMDAPTSARDTYYAFVFSQVGTRLQGANFWGWSGYAKPAHTQWEHGDEYTGDPAQEAQGLNGVYVTDSTVDFFKAAPVLPITGTWVNLAWKDVRNQYTNPADAPMGSAALWRAKVDEWHAMGLEYLVLMEVANEGRSFYPSALMPCANDGESLVEAILDRAGEHGMKVFLSTGWAYDQDDDIRRPEVQARQQAIMEELTLLYKEKPAFYGWYLPVEDCITPVFPASAVEAVNRLVAKAQALTPGKKTLISPYGMVYADFDRPDFARNIRALKVDIIAYQDEVGCVREPYPMRRLKENWKKLREVHRGSGIEMWANCETFTWEGNTNDRSSALIPAAYERLLAQQIAASEGGAERIVSFMFQGILEKKGSAFPLGQPGLSEEALQDYMDWKGGDPAWHQVQQTLQGRLRNDIQPESSEKGLTDGLLADSDPSDGRWVWLGTGKGRVELSFKGSQRPKELVLRCLDSAKDGILPPESIMVKTPEGKKLGEVRFTSWPDNRHDAWTDVITVPLKGKPAGRLIVELNGKGALYADEIYVKL